MTPRITAIIVLRVMALLILIWALTDLTILILLSLSRHFPAHTSNPIIAPSFDRTHHVWAFTLVRSAFPFVFMGLFGGPVLFLLSKPLGKLVADGLE